MSTAASRRLAARLPLPQSRHAAGTRAPPSLAQFVLLSLLLHALLILLFGSPAGGSRDGAAMWGALNVTIRGPLLDAPVDESAPTSTRAPLPGTQLLQRRAETKQPQMPPAPASPPMPTPAQTPAVDLAPVPPALIETPVRPESMELVPAPRVEIPKPVIREVPVVTVPALDLAPRPLPAAAELLPAPRVEKIQPALRELPVVAVPKLDWAPGAAIDPKLAPVVELPPVARAPIALPDTAMPLMRSTTVPAIAPELEPAARIVAPAARQVTAPAAPASHTAPAAPPADQPASSRRDETAPSGPAGRDSPIFSGRQAPADAIAPGAGPRIDLDRARASAREVAREGSGNRALLPFPMPPAPRKKSKEELAIENAWKPECKSAYKDMGLLAVVPLIANEFGEGNCRW